MNAIGLESKSGKNGGSIDYPLIAYDVAMWNDMHFLYEVLKYLISSGVEIEAES